MPHSENATACIASDSPKGQARPRKKHAPSGNEPSCKFRTHSRRLRLPNCKQRSLRVNSVLSCAKVYKAINRRGTPRRAFSPNVQAKLEGVHPCALTKSACAEIPPSISLSPMPSRPKQAPSCAAPPRAFRRQASRASKTSFPRFAPSWSHTTPKSFPMRN